jgi:hypothetical protein
MRALACILFRACYVSPPACERGGAKGQASALDQPCCVWGWRLYETGKVEWRLRADSNRARLQRSTVGVAAQGGNGPRVTGGTCWHGKFCMQSAALRVLRTHVRYGRSVLLCAWSSSPRQRAANQIGRAAAGMKPRATGAGGFRLIRPPYGCTRACAPSPGAAEI